MNQQTSAWKGILAGMAGGLAAAWVMNRSQDGKQKPGPLAGYAVAVLTGGLYGILAEYSRTATPSFELVRRGVRRLL